MPNWWTADERDLRLGEDDVSTVLATRTVRNLDRRPGEPSNEVKEVRGVRIDRDVPLPSRQHWGKLDEVLMALEPGESFEHTSRVGSRKMRDKGKQFTQRRLPSGKYRIWRMK